VALAVVSPRRFVSDYRVRVSARDLVPLGLPSLKAAQVLVVVTKAGDTLALNLKAPLVIHVAARQGRQIVAKDDHAVQYLLNATLPLRKTA
jgi:flagellar assembly factor FliW